MTDAATTRAIRLALAVSAVQAARAIEAAANLAAAMHAKLAAVYVQDEDLLRAAALPCTFEIGALASGAQPFNLAKTERALKREAIEVEQAVSAAAKNLGLGWTFEVLRGRAMDWPFDRAGVSDITVIGKSGLDLPGPHPVRRLSSMAAPILAIIDSTPDSLARLERILRDLGGNAPLAIWTPESTERDAQSIRRSIHTFGKETRRATTHLANTEAFSAASVARMMRTLRPGMVLIARSLAERIRTELPVVMRLVAGTMIFAP